jgi:hypothetical protein
MKKAFALIIAATCLIGAACVTVDATRLGLSPSRPIVPPGQVVIYSTAERVPGKYEEVALLNAAGASGWTSESGMYEAMKKKAGEYGANGIILDSMSEPSAGAKIAGAIFGIAAERKGKAIAIFVFPPEK